MVASLRSAAAAIVHADARSTSNRTWLVFGIGIGFLFPLRLLSLAKRERERDQSQTRTMMLVFHPDIPYVRERDVQKETKLRGNRRQANPKPWPRPRSVSPTLPHQVTMALRSLATKMRIPATAAARLTPAPRVSPTSGSRPLPYTSSSLASSSLASSSIKVCSFSPSHGARSLKQITGWST